MLIVMLPARAISFFPLFLALLCVDIHIITRLKCLSTLFEIFLC
nr:MAG TPA: hypothetical protein [Caudoviricetes sp.]